MYGYLNCQFVTEMNRSLNLQSKRLKEAMALLSEIMIMRSKEDADCFEGLREHLGKYDSK